VGFYFVIVIVITLTSLALFRSSEHIIVYIYITKTIMKFMILYKTRKPDDARARSAYQYLDDLLDKTFITDYFMDRSAAATADRPEK